MLDDKQKDALRKWYRRPEIIDQARKRIETEAWEDLEELIHMRSLIPLGRTQDLPDYLKTGDAHLIAPIDQNSVPAFIRQITNCRQKEQHNAHHQVPPDNHCPADHSSADQIDHHGKHQHQNEIPGFIPESIHFFYLHRMFDSTPILINYPLKDNHLQ